MDALDVLIGRCQDLADRGPGAISDLVAGSDLTAVLEATRTRPKPWFFTAGPSLTVFATVGAPGTGSAPHDHGLWAVIACLGGREGSRRYQVEDGVRETGISLLRAGEVHSLPAEAIHAVFNCWAEENLVLHLYGGDFITAAKRVWDPVTGTRSALGLVEPLVPVGEGP
jgi:predicted metal-dependent enzyme (double-stranded beta helix superfamily)